jgi:hypothetical protein
MWIGKPSTRQELFPRTAMLARIPRWPGLRSAVNKLLRLPSWSFLEAAPHPGCPMFSIGAHTMGQCEPDLLQSATSINVGTLNLRRREKFNRSSTRSVRVEGGLGASRAARDCLPSTLRIGPVEWFMRSRGAPARLQPLGSPECATHASRCTVACEKAGMQMVM